MPAAPTRSAAPRRGWARTTSRSGRRTRPSRSRGRSTASSSTRPAPTSARSPRAPTRAGADAVRPGGTLVYSTCTLSPAENEDLIRAFLAGRGDFQADDLRAEVPLWNHEDVPGFLQTLPHRDGTEGFFIARFRKEPA